MSKLREALERLERATTIVLETLRREALGTPLNQQRHDALGVEAYGALALAREALAVKEETPSADCPHEAWEEIGGGRKCSDCREWLGNKPAPVPEEAGPVCNACRAEEYPCPRHR